MPAGPAGVQPRWPLASPPDWIDTSTHQPTRPARRSGMSWRSIWVVGTGGSGGAWRPPWPGRARGLPGRGVGVAVGSGGAAVGVSVGSAWGSGSACFVVVGQTQRRDGEARAEQHDQDGGDGEQRAAGVLHAPARGDEQPLPQQVERVAGLAGLRVALDELGDADRRGRRCVFVVAQHAAVDRDALGLRQPGERLGQVGPAAFGDRGQRRFAEQERRQADPLARGVRHLAAPFGVGDDVPGGAQQPRDRRALARLVLAPVLVRPRERLPEQVEQHVRLPRAAPEIRGHGPHVAFVELAERLRVVAPQQLGVRPHVL